MSRNYQKAWRINKRIATGTGVVTDADRAFLKRYKQQHPLFMSGNGSSSVSGTPPPARPPTPAPVVEPSPAPQTAPTPDPQPTPAPAAASSTASSQSQSATPAGSSPGSAETSSVPPPIVVDGEIVDGPPKTEDEKKQAAAHKMDLAKKIAAGICAKSKAAGVALEAAGLLAVPEFLIDMSEEPLARWVFEKVLPEELGDGDYDDYLAIVPNAGQGLAYFLQRKKLLEYEKQRAQRGDRWQPEPSAPAAADPTRPKQANGTTNGHQANGASEAPHGAKQPANGNADPLWLQRGLDGKVGAA